MENRKIFQHRCTSVLFTVSKNTWDWGNSIYSWFITNAPGPNKLCWRKHDTKDTKTLLFQKKKYQYLMHYLNISLLQSQKF